MKLNPDSPIRAIARNGLRRLTFGAVIALALPLAALAQATGMITGRVFNPATGEYIRNAEIRIEGTQQVAQTEDGGYYRLTNAPTGDITITATYTGHQSATAKVSVAPGATVTRDFELAPTGSNRRAEDVVQLGAFVVSTEREGQA